MWSPHTQTGSITWYQKHAKPKMLLKFIRPSFSVCSDHLISRILWIERNRVYTFLLSPIHSGQIRDLPAFEQTGGFVTNFMMHTRNFFQS